MTLRPANNPSPSSATVGMTWLRCSIDHSLSASIERSACSAGIILEPGRPARLASDSRLSATKPGTNKNSPPQTVSKRRGTSDNWRTSATASTVGRGRSGRSSSRRRGNGANPSALSTSRTAVGLRPRLRDLSVSLISYTEWLRLRSSTIVLRAADFFGCVRGPNLGDTKNSGWGSRRKWWHMTWNEAGVYPNARATSEDGRSSKKNARNASYCRCLAELGSMKKRRQSLSDFGAPIGISRQ